jgi:signal transduction histidine kinase
MMRAVGVTPYRARLMRALRSLPRVDVTIALILTVYAVAESIAIEAPAAWTAAAVVVTAALGCRTRHPVPVVAAIVALISIPGLVTDETVDSVLPLPLIILAGWTAGHESASGRVALAATTAIILALAAGLGTSPAENPETTDLVALLVLVGGAAGAGRLMRLRHAENQQLQTLTAELAAERDRRAQEAVAEERARVARELHDIVAHSVSLIAVQAGAAEDLLGRDDARARRSLQAVQETARGALGEMRRLLTVLRETGEEPGLSPQPGLDAVPDLVSRARDSGLPVTLHEEGARDYVPPGVDLSAYRIVQEALTNVRKHAGPVPTEVVVRYGPREVLVGVMNDVGAPADGLGGSSGGGRGIPGMRERVRIYGGTFDSGRRDGRFVVHARLPLTGVVE